MDVPIVSFPPEAFQGNLSGKPNLLRIYDVVFRKTSSKRHLLVMAVDNDSVI
jgi:hypothetical protein